jgi:hypothetical protein
MNKFFLRIRAIVVNGLVSHQSTMHSHQSTMHLHVRIHAAIFHSHTHSFWVDIIKYFLNHMIKKREKEKATSLQLFACFSRIDAAHAARARSLSHARLVKKPASRQIWDDVRTTATRLCIPRTRSFFFSPSINERSHQRRSAGDRTVVTVLL